MLASSQTQIKRRQSIFISYCNADVSWKDRLIKQILALQDDFIDLWHDKRIQTGRDWYLEIISAIKRARLAILIVSENFLTSPFIRNEEIPVLLERQVREGLVLYPIIVRHCPWQRVEWLSRIQTQPASGVPLESMSEEVARRWLSNIAGEVQDLLSTRHLKNLPPVGAMVPLTSPYNPPCLIGLKIHSNHPNRLHFVLSCGDEEESNELLLEWASDLVDGFLTCLTLPDESIWVNLSPSKPDKIIDPIFGATRIGADFLEQDYLLKQVNASLTFPETKTGDAYWKSINKYNHEHHSESAGPSNLFERVWIVPDRAAIFEGCGSNGTS